MTAGGQAGPDQGARTRSYLFLDLDGVMIPFDSRGIDLECAANLRRIMASVPGLGIVLSSTWRLPPVERFENIWQQSGLPRSWIVGRTPDLAGRPGSIPGKLRGLEIRRWLEFHAPGQEGFAILDDQIDEIEPCFASAVIFETNPRHGLTRETADAVIRLLRPV